MPCSRPVRHSRPGLVGPAPRRVTMPGGVLERIHSSEEVDVSDITSALSTTAWRYAPTPRIGCAVHRRHGDLSFMGAFRPSAMDGGQTLRQANDPSSSYGVSAAKRGSPTHDPPIGGKRRPIPLPRQRWPGIDGTARARSTSDALTCLCHVAAHGPPRAGGSRSGAAGSTPSSRVRSASRVPHLERQKRTRVPPKGN